jgi:adenylate cyclase
MVDMSIPAGASLQAPKRVKRDGAFENKYLTQALEKSKEEGLLLAIKARFVALLIVGVMLVFLINDWAVLYYHFLIVLFLLNGWAQVKVGRVGHSHKELLLLWVDLGLMAITVGVPCPIGDEVWSSALTFKWSNFSYFYILLASAAIIYSWRTLVAIVWMTSTVWIAVFAWAYFQPPILPEIDREIATLLADYPHIYELVEINSLDWHARMKELVIFAIVAGILALNGWRSNQLLEKQANVARERANLARYFAPNLVDHLASKDDPLGDVRAQSVVVMFVDIVGFTKMAEHDAPERVVRFLREFHLRMEKEVFEFAGTLDKFLGDGLMITFGTPNETPDDAKNALNCAAAMQKSIDEWNEQRSAQGDTAVSLSIGLHCGSVILGDIGSQRRMEFAVLGDVVNVSSRLEAMTRDLNVRIVASAAVVDAASAKIASTLGFEARGMQQIRGRDEEVAIWAKA